MPGGQHEAVPISPVWISRIIFKVFCEKHCRYVSGAHRHSRMARIGGLNSIHGQSADGISKLSVINVLYFRQDAVFILVGVIYGDGIAHYCAAAAGEEDQCYAIFVLSQPHQSKLAQFICPVVCFNPLQPNRQRSQNFKIRLSVNTTRRIKSRGL